MNILLVNPSNSEKMYQSLASPLRGIEPPFLAGLIASHYKQWGVSVGLIDADMENLSPEATAERVIIHNPEMVIVTVQGVSPSNSSTPKMSATIDLVRKIKERNSKIVVSLVGLHPSALPELTLRETGADKIFDMGGVFVGYPPVDWELINPANYRAHNWHCLSDVDNRSPYGVLYSSWGCPFSCSYCNIHAQYWKKYGVRKVDDVLAELDALVELYHVKNIKIMDELFAINEKRVLSICEPIIKRGYGLNMWAYARVDSVTKDMLEAMKGAGISWLGYGFESASELARRGVNKKFTQKRMEKAIQMTRDAGINICANFMFGLPDDDDKSNEQTIDMMKEYLFEWINVYCLMPYPGSELYTQASKEHRGWLPDSWDGYAQLGYEAQPLPTKHLSAKEVLALRDTVFMDYFTSPRYLKMIRQKFGEKAVEHIRDMAKHRLKRKLLGD